MTWWVTEISIWRMQNYLITGVNWGLVSDHWARRGSEWWDIHRYELDGELISLSGIYIV